MTQHEAMLLTVKDTAAYLGITHDELDRVIERGALPVVPAGLPERAIHVLDLEEYTTSVIRGRCPSRFQRLLRRLRAARLSPQHKTSR